MKDRIVLVLSGGVESLVISAMAAETGSFLHAVFVNYGQRAYDRELCAVQSISRRYGIQVEFVSLDLPFLSSHLLIDPDRVIYNEEGAKELDLPWGGAEGMAHTGHIVPLRNLILTSVAASFAETIGATQVWTGFDYARAGASTVRRQEMAADKSPDFVRHLESCIQEAATLRISLRAPLQHNTKADTLKVGNDLGVDWSVSWSCYNSFPLHCGACGPCRARKAASIPTRYIDPEFVRSRVI